MAFGGPQWRVALWLTCGLSGCADKPPAPADAAPAARTPADAAPPDAAAPQRAPHPGMIELITQPGGHSRKVPHTEVPSSVAWGLIDGRSVPIVRVIRRRVGTLETVTRYGPGNELVDRTAKRPTVPAMPSPQKISPQP